MYILTRCLAPLSPASLLWSQGLVPRNLISGLPICDVLGVNSVGDVAGVLLKCSAVFLFVTLAAARCWCLCLTTQPSVPYW